MDRDSNVPEARRSMSLGRNSSTGSSVRRRYIGQWGHIPSHFDDDDIESERVSEAGDIGDRALGSRRQSLGGSLRLDDSLFESGRVFPIPDILAPRHGSHSLDLESSHAASLAPSLSHRPDGKEDEQKPLSLWMEYCSYLSHLAVFGILGVLTRYLLEKLFSSRIAHLTSDGSVLYLDLPSNMVGSFLMGWFGVVFKGDISKVSDYLAVGLTTGYLGSLTTFSGWNQKMLDLSVRGKWHLSFLGFLVGLFLCAYSIIFGVETAKGLKWLMRRRKTDSEDDSKVRNNWRLDSVMRRIASMMIMLLLLGILWAVSGTLLKREFDDGGSEPQLWLGCVVGPAGVWIRWFLARLNGSGLGKARYLKWVPFGTLIANVSAACVMAALATVKKAVNSKDCDTVATGIQFGLMGCLSTVSTFMAEYNAMRESNRPWRAYAYASFTMAISFGLGVLIYNVPVWAKGYK